MWNRSFVQSLLYSSVSWQVFSLLQRLYIHRRVSLLLKEQHSIVKVWITFHDMYFCGFFFFRNSLVYFMECCTFLLYPPCRCFWFFTPSAICTTSTGAREKTSLSIHKTQLQNENQSSRDILVLLENGVGESLIYRFLFSFSRTVEPLVYNNKELHTSINFFIVACSVFEKLLNLCHKM